jgi:glycosyltransferase involved in cell wall biosynthesis
MKILYLSYRIGGKSGSAKSSVDVLNAIALLKKDTFCFTPLIDYKEIFNIVFNSNFKSVKYFIFKNKSSLLHSIWRLITIILLKVFQKHVDSSNNDDILLIVNTNIDKLYIDYIRREYNVKITVNINRGGVNFYGKNGIQDQLVFLNSFDYVVFLTKSLKREWTNVGFSKKAFVIPNCVDRGRELSCLKNDGENIDKKNLAYIGSIQKRKGQDIALKCLIENNLKSLSLSFYGNYVASFKHEFESLLDKAKSIGIDASYNGYKKIHHILSLHDIVILCSRGEAMPRTVLEALMYGRIVIASNTDGIKDMIEHEYNGFLYDCNDPSEFYELLIKVTSNEYDLNKISANAKKTYAHNYSFQNYVSRWKNSIELVLSDNDCKKV